MMGTTLVNIIFPYDEEVTVCPWVIDDEAHFKGDGVEGGFQTEVLYVHNNAAKRSKCLKYKLRLKRSHHIVYD